MVAAILKPPVVYADKTDACPPHHWRFETPDGPLTAGVCIKCRATASLPNWCSKTY